MKKLILLLFMFIQFSAYAEEQLPLLTNRVTDLTETLTTTEVELLEEKLKQLETATGNQVVVVIISTTGSETIEGYSIRLAEKWKIGREEVDDGIILLIAKSDRKTRIEVGYGLEGVITDAASARIINEYIVPKFKNGYFAEGINNGLDVIINLLGLETLDTSETSKNNTTEGVDETIKEKLNERLKEGFNETNEEVNEETNEETNEEVNEESNEGKLNFYYIFFFVFISIFLVATYKWKALIPIAFIVFLVMWVIYGDFEEAFSNFMGGAVLGIIIISLFKKEEAAPTRSSSYRSSYSSSKSNSYSSNNLSSLVSWHHITIYLSRLYQISFF